MSSGSSGLEPVCKALSDSCLSMGAPTRDGFILLWMRLIEYQRTDSSLSCRGQDNLVSNGPSSTRPCGIWQSIGKGGAKVSHAHLTSRARIILVEELIGRGPREPSGKKSRSSFFTGTLCKGRVERRPEGVRNILS